MAFFNLLITDKYDFFDDGIRYAEGYIVIDNHREKLRLSLDFWNENQYKKQWIDASMRIIDGSSCCCFITDIQNPDNSSFISSWVFYNLDGHRLIIQNHNIDWSDREDNESICKLINEREKKSENNIDISEWVLDIKDIVSFYEKLKADLMRIGVEPSQHTGV